MTIGPTDISLHDTLLVDAQVLFRQLDDEAVLLDLKSGTYFGLNDVGARTWQLILEKGSLSDVRDALVREYAADSDVIERDLLDLGRQLVERGLVEMKRNVP
jgi:hypothetical protein